MKLYNAFKRVRRLGLAAAGLAIVAASVAHAQCGTPTGQPLNFTPHGDFGTAGQSMWSWVFTPTGGTPPYRFTTTSNKIPGFRVGTYPVSPSYLQPGQGSLFGQAPFGVQTNTPFTAQVQLSDCTGASVTYPITVRFSPIDINVQWMPQVSEGQHFSLPITGIGGTPPYQFSIASGAFPSGVTLNTATSRIEGTPAAGSSGNYNFVINISDSAGATLRRGYGLTVITLGVTSPRLVIAKVGQSFRAPISITGGTPPYHFILDQGSGLPSGVSIDPTGAIQGTPTYTDDQVWGFGIDVTDSAPVPHTATFGFGVTIEGTLPQPVQLTPRYQSVELIPDATRANYRIDSAAMGGGVPPWTCAPAPGSSLPPGTSLLDISTINSGYTPGSCFFSGSTIAPGDYPLTIRVTDSVGNFADFRAAWHMSTMGIWNSYPPYGGFQPYLNQPASEPLILFGGTPPYTITPAQAYPVGLTIGANDPDAVLEGTALEAGFSLPLNIDARDAAGGALTNESFTYVLAGPGIITLGVTNGPQYAATTTIPYDDELDVLGPVHNPPYTATLLADPTGPHPTRSTLPAGLSLVNGISDPNDLNAVAAIEGTPTEAGDFSYLLKITDAKGNLGQRAISLHVNAIGATVDDTPDCQITTTAFTYNRVTKVYSGTVTIKNISSAQLNAPLSAVLTQLTSGVTAINATGTTKSGPFYGYDPSPLLPGQSISFPVEFTDPSAARIGFVLKVYTGQPQ